MKSILRTNSETDTADIYIESVAFVVFVRCCPCQETLLDPFLL